MPHIQVPRINLTIDVGIVRLKVAAHLANSIFHREPVPWKLFRTLDPVLPDGKTRSNQVRTSKSRHCLKPWDLRRNFLAKEKSTHLEGSSERLRARQVGAVGLNAADLQ